MSKAKTVTKVLKTAYKRIEKGWTTGTWHRRDDDGNNFVCLEGAIFGFCTDPQTQQQRDALALVEQIIIERHPVFSEYDSGAGRNFNDTAATQDEMLEVVKLAIIRSETGGPIDDDEFIEFDPDGEELKDLLPAKS